jgi:AcrR family transcriptional regulator
LTPLEQPFNDLNMRSTPASSTDDRTTAARIRDAAITCFAEAGVAATSVRTIAAAVDVSPGLVMHHFGSKDHLRQACDRHVAALIREAKEKAVAEGAGIDPVGQIRTYEDGLPLLRYLARTLADGSPHVADLVDEMVADATAYTEQAVETGLMVPSDDPRGRAAVLTLWSLGAVVLHEHVHRLLGADLTGDVTDMAAYAVPAAEVLGRGVLAPGVYERIRDEFPRPDKEPS